MRAISGVFFIERLLFKFRLGSKILPFIIKGQMFFLFGFISMVKLWNSKLCRIWRNAIQVPRGGRQKHFNALPFNKSPPQFGPSKIFYPLHPETDLELGYGGLRGIKGSLLSSHMDIFISGEFFDPGFL